MSFLSKNKYKLLISAFLGIILPLTLAIVVYRLTGPFPLHPIGIKEVGEALRNLFGVEIIVFLLSYFFIRVFGALFHLRKKALKNKKMGKIVLIWVFVIGTSLLVLYICYLLYSYIYTAFGPSSGTLQLPKYVN